MLHRYKKIFKHIHKEVDQSVDEYFVAGGSVLSLYMTGSINSDSDIDIFFRNINDFNNALNSIKNPAHDTDKLGYFINCIIKVECETDVKLSPVQYTNSRFDVDLIKVRMADTIEDLCNSFDLINTSIGISKSGVFYKHEMLDELIVDKKIMINADHTHIRNPIRTLLRAEKYAMRHGFKLSKSVVDELMDMIDFQEHMKGLRNYE